MAVNQKTARLLDKVFEAGFFTEKGIAAMTVDGILTMQGITVGEISMINELQKAVRSNKAITFLSGGEA